MVTKKTSFENKKNKFVSYYKYKLKYLHKLDLMKYFKIKVYGLHIQKKIQFIIEQLSSGTAINTQK